MKEPTPATLEKWNHLLDYLRKYERIGVAVSGGVDSALVCCAAVHALGRENVQAYTIESPLETAQGVKDARKIAEYLGVNLQLMELNELEIDDIRQNPSKRCYFCKLARLAKVKELADQVGIIAMADGSNADDLKNYRPGKQALQELGVLSPLAEMGIRKAEVRELAQWQGLPVWSKPSTPCLATRFPYGTEINAQRLQQVGCAEQGLREMGFNEFRVRYHHEVARIEVPQKSFEVVMQQRAEITSLIKSCGFLYVTLDLQGFRSGSMDEALQ
mgnify:CR=1 FL=1